MSPFVANILAGPNVTRVLMLGEVPLVEIEPLRFYPINRRAADGLSYVGRKQRA